LRKRDSKRRIEKLKDAHLPQRHLTTRPQSKVRLMETSALTSSNQDQRDGSRRRPTRPTMILNMRRARKPAHSDLPSIAPPSYKTWKVKALITSRELTKPWTE
jgi:hypothetical protein